MEVMTNSTNVNAVVPAPSMTMIPASKNAQGTLAKAQAAQPESLRCSCRAHDGFCRMHFPMFSKNNGGDGVGSGSFLDLLWANDAKESKAVQ